MKKNFEQSLEELYKDCGLGVCIVTLLLILIVIIGLFCLEVALGTWLWKIIAVSVFGLPALSFWQFLGLDILLTILIPHNTINTKEN